MSAPRQSQRFNSAESSYINLDRPNLDLFIFFNAVRSACLLFYADTPLTKSLTRRHDFFHRLFFSLLFLIDQFLLSPDFLSSYRFPFSHQYIYKFSLTRVYITRPKLNLVNCFEKALDWYASKALNGVS